MTVPSIRRAVAADVPALDAIVLDAKAHWGYAPELLEAWKPDLVVPPHSLGEHPVLVAEEDGGPVGFVQVVTDREPWELAALWVSPTSMGRGIGKALLTHALALAAAAGRSELAIDADPHALGLYRSCGARVVGTVAAPIPGDPGRVRPQLRISTAHGA